MNLTKKILAIFLCLMTSTVMADTLKIVVPFSPGGAVDQNAQALSRWLSKNNVQNTVVYYPGAEGDIAYNYTVKNKDSAVIIGSHGPLIFSHVLLKRPNYYSTDTVIIGPTIIAAQGFITGPKGFENLNSLVKKALAESLPCGVSNSTGTAELLKFNKEHGTKFVPIPYKGSSFLATDIMGNHIICAYDTLTSHYQSNRSSKVKILSTSFPSNFTPGVPLTSSSLRSATAKSWYSIVLIRDSEILKNQSLMELLKTFSKDNESIKSLLDQGFSSAVLNPDINKDIHQQTEYYRELLKDQ